MLLVEEQNVEGMHELRNDGWKKTAEKAGESDCAFLLFYVIYLR